MLKVSRLPLAIICVLAIMCSLPAVGCFFNEEDDDPVVTELEGTWIAADTYDAVDEEIESQKFVFSGNSIASSSTTYDGPGNVKSEALLTFNMTGSFTIGAALTSPAGAKKIDIIVSSMTVTPLTDDVVFNFNSNTLFGYNDWVKNVPKDVAGKTDPDGEVMTSVGGGIYSIFKIDGTNLYLGDDSTGDEKTDATRSTALESAPYIKQ